MRDNIPEAAAACLCQHHASAYAEFDAIANTLPYDLDYQDFLHNEIIVSQSITITERCCINVICAVTATTGLSATKYQINRPMGTNRTTDYDYIANQQFRLYHHTAREVLNAGTYTYYLRSYDHTTHRVVAAWMKIITSDCEG